jgi:hypothetical protein
MEQHYQVFRAIRRTIEQSLDTRVALLRAEQSGGEGGEPAVRSYAFEARNVRRAFAGLAGADVTTAASVACCASHSGEAAAQWVGFVASGAACLRVALPDDADDPCPAFVEGEIVLARDAALLRALVDQMSRRARRSRRVVFRGR